MFQNYYDRPYNSDFDHDRIPIPPQWIVDALLIPNHPGRPQAKSLIDGQILRIQKEIDKTDEILKKLQRMRTSYAREYRMLRHLVSKSVTTRLALPPEILVEIFEFCADNWWEDADTWVYGFKDNIPSGPRGWEAPALEPKKDWPGWHSWTSHPVSQYLLC